MTATGSFNKTFTIPPTGGPSIPIQVFPIIIGGVPVAVLDVSAYVEGEIEVSADGRAEGQFQLKNSNPTYFSFGCSGRGCSARSNQQPAATTTNQSAQIEGTVSVKPAIYVALELDLNYEALSARRRSPAVPPGHGLRLRRRGRLSGDGRGLHRFRRITCSAPTSTGDWSSGPRRW